MKPIQNVGKHSKYKKDEHVFTGDYAKKAHFQKGYNAQIIDELVESVLRWFPEAKEKPIKIADLCCGDGSSTHELLQKLTERGVKIELSFYKTRNRFKKGYFVEPPKIPNQ